MTSVAPIYQKIYAVIRRIPKGKVATYGQIALLAGIGRQPRRVGYALRIAADEMNLPWHRVVNSQGTVSLRSEPDVVEYQRSLLRDEGVEFGRDFKISLPRYQWQPKGGFKREKRK